MIIMVESVQLSPGTYLRIIVLRFLTYKVKLTKPLKPLVIGFVFFI